MDKKKLEKKIPFVIKNGAKLLQAYNKWDDNYLKKIIGKDIFRVETSYNTVFSPSDPYSKAVAIKMTFNDFSKKYINNKMNQTDKKHLNYYLAEIDIPDKLLDDVKYPFSDVINKDPDERYLFLGVGGNITRAHTDDSNNFYFLLDGTKEISLISPDYDHKLYLEKRIDSDGNDEGYENYLIFDIDNIDYEKYPLMKNVPIKKIKLQKGEMLYIPKGWWHRVKSGLSRNLAVSMWYN